jgi:diguanylate cyclase (GGDEF)-like protein
MIKSLFINVDSRTGKYVCIITSALFFIIHTLYSIFFLLDKDYFLGYYNIGSSILYLSWILILLKFKLLKTYAFMTLFEILLFVCLCIIFVGWKYGVQHYLLGLVMLIFYVAYMAKKISSINIHPVILSGLCMFLFVFFAIFQDHVSPIYETETWAFGLYVTHAIVSFVFEITFGFLLYNTVFRLEDKIHDESVLDALTQINNRKGIQEIYKNIGEDSLSNYLVAIYDIDNFKHLNDKYGHPFGDIVLKEIAQIIKNTLPNSFACRWGGEEFVSIIKIEGNEEEMKNLIDNVRLTIKNNEFKLNNKHVNVTITIGVSAYNNYDSLENWVSASDKKLYDGKKNGKDRVVF